MALDDVTGHVVARGTDEHRWPVSLSIRIDFLADPPLDKTSMSVHGELIARDERSGTTRGSVTDDSGRTIALVTQRSHLVAVEAQPTSPRTSFDLPSVETTVRDALGFTVSAGGIVELPPTPLAANGMGNVHGGVLICGSEFAAMSAVDAGGVLRTTSIDIATSARGGMPVIRRPSHVMSSTVVVPCRWSEWLRPVRPESPVPWRR